MKKIMKYFAFITIAVVASSGATAQAGNAAYRAKEPKTVAIFIYPGVELLDFAGPAEVFDAAGFKVYTISEDGKDIVSQGFVTVQPNYGLENAPRPDIIVLPGGQARPVANDRRVLDWIRALKDRGVYIMSVCNAAQILGKAGMLGGFNVTTHHLALAGLQKMVPDTKVLADTRYVDNGDFMTTGGISAGIDGAFHLVARIKGNDSAKAVAEYIEYNNWSPDLGRMDVENPMIKRLREGTVNAGDAGATDVGEAWAGPIPYPGEFVNLASELTAQHAYERAKAVIATGLRCYPDSGLLIHCMATLSTGDSK